MTIALIIAALVFLGLAIFLFVFSVGVASDPEGRGGSIALGGLIAAGLCVVFSCICTVFFVRALLH